MIKTTWIPFDSTRKVLPIQPQKEGLTADQQTKHQVEPHATPSFGKAKVPEDWQFYAV